MVQRMKRALSFSLYAGAAWNGAFAVAVVLIPDLCGRLLQLPLPEPRFYLWLLSIFLGLSAATYVLGGRDPERQRGNVWVAICGRLTGAGVLGTLYVAERLWALGALAAADLLFGALHLWLLLRRA